MKFEEWKIKLTSKDRGDRYDAADSMPEADPDQTIPLLIQTLHDEDEMVRVAALETLGFLPDERVRRALQAHYEKETDPLAKAYTLESLGKVGEIEDFIFLLKLLKERKDPRAKISSTFGLLQGLSYFTTPIIVDSMEEEDYTLRMASANQCTEYLETFISNFKNIEDAFQARLEQDMGKPWCNESIEKAVSLIRSLLQGLPEEEIKKNNGNESNSPN